MGGEESGHNIGSHRLERMRVEDDSFDTQRTFGLYSAFRACMAIVFKSSRQSRLTVATMFLSSGKGGASKSAGQGKREAAVGVSDGPLNVASLQHPLLRLKRSSEALFLLQKAHGPS